MKVCSDPYFLDLAMRINNADTLEKLFVLSKELDSYGEIPIQLDLFGGYYEIQKKDV